MKVGDGGMATLARRPDVDIGKCNLVMQISIQPRWLPLLCVTIRAGNEGSRSFHNLGEDPYYTPNRGLLRDCEIFTNIRLRLYILHSQDRLESESRDSS